VEFSRVHRGEVVSMIGGVLLALSIFLPWFTLGNENTTLNDYTGPDVSVSAWNALLIFRWLFLAAALAPFILTYIVVRGHALTWPRGEVTAVVGITAFVFVLVRGFLIQPGDPTSQIGIGIGFYVALVGTLVMTAGALMHRAEMDATARKPPGVL
jgi:hypothetical protein